MTAAVVGEQKLLDQIARDPDDVATHLVYADLLTAKNDPRGELIVIMGRLAENPGDAQLGIALDAYMTKHRSKLFGSLGRHAGIAWDFHLGFLRSVRYVPDTGDDIGKVMREIFKLPIGAMLRDFLVFTDYEYEIKKAKTAEKHRPATLKEVRFPKRHQLMEDALKNGKDGANVLWLALNTENAGELASVAKLENLEFLEISTNSLTALPEEIANLERLRRLDIDWCYSLATLPPEIFGIETLAYISMYDCRGLNLHMGRCNNLLSGFARAKTPSARRIFETKLMMGELDRTASVDDLLAALDNNVEVVREGALRGLETKIPDPFAASFEPRGMSIAAIGSINFDKKQLAKQLAEIGAQLTTKIDPKTTTHVLVGTAPGGKQGGIGKLPIITEKQLIPRLESTGKPQKSNATKSARTTKGPAPAVADVAQIKALLATRDEKVVMGALSLLSAGGGGTVTPDLFVHLVVIWQDVTLKKSRDEAKKLLAIHAPATLTDAVKTHLKSSLLLEGLGETKRAARIATFCNAAKVIDAVELAELLVHRAGVGLQYIFANAPPAKIVDCLKAMVKTVDGVPTLNLSSKELTEVPKELVTLSDAVSSIDLSANHLGEWPEPLLSMKGLTHLDISGNRIRRIPDAAAKLPLKSFNMSFSHLRKFPPPVLAMTSLEDLGLGNSQDYVEDEARITGLPAEIRALKKLRVFDYSFNILETLPDELFELTSLEEMRLFQCVLPKDIPAGLKKLTKLRKLNVSYSTWATPARKAALKKVLPPKCEVET